MTSLSLIDFMSNLAQDDQLAIMQLKSELSKAWTMFDTANEKEQRLKEKCQQYKGNFEPFSSR